MNSTGPGKSYRNGLTIKQLFKLFPDDATAEAWFTAARWPNGIACPHCGSLSVANAPTHKTMPYRCRDCRKRFSAKTGTALEGSNVGFQNWMIAIYYLTTNLKGISSMKLARELGVTQKTAWFMGHRLREARKSPGGIFAGPVEADETFVGGKAKNMHAWKKALLGPGGYEKVAVAGIKDQATGKVKAKVVGQVDGPTLKGFVAKHTAPGAAIYTDEATAYSGLPNHDTVKHGAGQYVNGQVTINGMESFWSMFKRGFVGTYHRMSPEHLHRYVAEFEGRYNDRPLDTVEQIRGVVEGLEGKRLKYDDLTDHWASPAVAVQ